MKTFQDHITDAKAEIASGRTAGALTSLIEAVLLLPNSSAFEDRALLVDDSNPKDDLKDDIEYFKEKAEKAAEKGDTEAAAKNSSRAKLLKSAVTLVEKKEDDAE